MSGGGPRLLVSACLLGRPVRHDGSAATLGDALLAQWRRDGLLVPFCPELAAGFGAPRRPAEIVGGDGEDVLDGRARVLEDTGADVTDAFVAGAEAALATARQAGCAFALLTDSSPSCGSDVIYDGAFDGGRRAGCGVTVALLRRAGLAVFAPQRIQDLDAVLRAEAA